jgi:hypothetical protein
MACYLTDLCRGVKINGVLLKRMATTVKEKVKGDNGKMSR